MALQPASESPDGYAPIDWLMMPPSYDIDRVTICDVCSSLISPPPPFPQPAQPPPLPSPQIATSPLPSPQIATSPLPSLQPVTSHPRKWYEIPQTPYSHGRRQLGYTSSESIIFQVDGSPGVNMGDAFRKKFRGLKGQDDLVLQNAKMAICCRFLFPGYPPNKSPQIFTVSWSKERESITRSKLAHRVARKLNQYLNSMGSSHTMDASTDQRWEIGEGFMLLNNMYLAKLESVSIGSFQPQIWVIDRTA